MNEQRAEYAMHLLRLQQRKSSSIPTGYSGAFSRYFLMQKKQKRPEERVIQTFCE